MVMQAIGILDYKIRNCNAKLHFILYCTIVLNKITESMTEWSRKEWSQKEWSGRNGLDQEWSK
jgi:hypothetical protein